MTVAQLIKELSKLDPAAPVFFACSYGDCVGTVQALPVEEVQDEVALSESAYSDSGLKVADSDEDDSDPSVDNAVVLSSDGDIFPEA